MSAPWLGFFASILMGGSSLPSRILGETRGRRAGMRRLMRFRAYLGAHVVSCRRFLASLSARWPHAARVSACHQPTIRRRQGRCLMPRYASVSKERRPDGLPLILSRPTAIDSDRRLAAISPALENMALSAISCYKLARALRIGRDCQRADAGS